MCTGAGAGSGSTGFRRVPKVPEKVWEALVQSQVRFNRVPEKVPEKVWEALVQPGQVQQASGEGSGAGSPEALVQSQVGFNRAPKNVW